MAQRLACDLHSQPKFGVVLKKRVRPRDAAAVLVLAVRHRGRRSAVDRATARGVGYDHMIAEKSRDQRDIRRLAAARARAVKFKIRAGKAHALDA